jgi:hypothetical protein
MLVGTGFAFAGGGNRYSHSPSAPHYRGYQHSNPGWGHTPYQYHYYHGPRYHRNYHYGPPARYYYNRYYYRGDSDRYDGAYYFSGAFSEPGFGFVFGTRGNW